MKPMKSAPPLEKTIEKAIRKELEKRGWGTWKTHGNRFQAGFPDLYCIHPERGTRWIEVKRPKTGRVTPAQVAQFSRFEELGVGVWILTDRSLTGLLDGPAQWRKFLRPNQLK